MLMKTNMKANISTTAWTTVKSRAMIASITSAPSPGHAKTVSVTTNPVISTVPMSPK